MDETQALGLLDDFARAWNRHDCDALLSLVTADCVFETAAGKERYGTRFMGSQLREAFSAVWKAFPDAAWKEVTHVVCGDRGFSEWTFHGTDGNGVAVQVRGVDLFTFRNDRISRKDTFRKNRTT